MAFKVNDRLPDDCALRRGTLISGVPMRNDSDPMQPAALSLGQALQKRLAEANGETAPPRQPTSTTHKPRGTT